MPDVFIFLPAFHALLNSTERPTPIFFLQALPLYSFAFSFLFPRSGERAVSDEKETYSLVYPCLRKIYLAPAIPRVPEDNKASLL